MARQDRVTAASGGKTQMRNSRQRSWVRRTVVCAVLGLAFLQSTVRAKGPVCLDHGGKRPDAAHVVFSPDGKWIAAMMHTQIVVWDFTTKEMVASRPYEIVKPYNTGFTAIAFSADSQGIVHADDAGRVCLWDGSAGWADGADREILGPPIGSDGRPKLDGPSWGDIAISPDGTRLAVPRGWKMIKIVEIDTGKDVGELDIGRFVNSVQFADQGKMLVVGTPGTSRDLPLVQFWNMETLTAGEPLRTPCPRYVKGYVNQAVLSPTQKMLALVVGSNLTSEVRLYELPSRRWTTLTRYDRRVICHHSFSPDGRLLAVPIERGPSDPAAVLVWDLTAKVWRRFDCPLEIPQRNIAFMNAAFSPDGRYLAGGLAHPEVAVCIWDLQEDADRSTSD